MLKTLPTGPFFCPSGYSSRPWPSAKNPPASSSFATALNPPPPRQYLLLDYGRHWDFPKGHVEKGEDLLQTALRELQEETGVTHARLIPGFNHEIEYYFRDSKKDLIHKSVWFCLAQTNHSTIHLSDEHVGYEYLSFEDALKRLTYASAKQILRAAEAFLVARA